MLAVNPLLLENPFQTFWREGLSCSPVQFLQNNIWSARVDIGCVLERTQLIALENEGRDETNYPSPPNFTFFGDPDVPFGPQGPQPLAPPEPHQPPGPPSPPCFPPGWPPAPSPAGGRERVETGNTSRGRLHPHPRPSPLEPQHFPIPMSDGEDDDDQPTHRGRGIDNGLDVSENILTCQCRTSHKFNLWLLQNQMMGNELRIFQLLIPHHHQLNKGIAPKDPRDLDHVSEFFHVHPHMLVDDNSLLYLLLREYSRIRQPIVKMKIQKLWIHRIVCVVIQGHHKIKKTHGDRVHKHRKERKIQPKKQPCTLQKAKTKNTWIQMKTMKNLKMSQEPLQILRLVYQYYLFQ